MFGDLSGPMMLAVIAVVVLVVVALIVGIIVWAVKSSKRKSITAEQHAAELQRAYETGYADRSN